MRIFSVSACMVIFVYCIIVQYQASAEGIQCYKCNSYNDKRCAGKDLDAFKYNCSDDQKMDGHVYTLCRMVYQELEFQTDGLPYDIRVIRECGWDDSKFVDKCYHTIGLGGKQIVCSCTDDLCNSAPKSVPGKVIAITLLASLTAFFYLKLV